MCSNAGCVDPGDRAPRLTFHLRRGRTKRTPSCVYGVKICERCRPGVTVERLTYDKRVVATVLANNPGYELDHIDLEWVSFDHPDYVALYRAVPS